MSEMEDPYEYRTTGLFKDGYTYHLPEEDWDLISPSDNNIRKTDIQGVDWDEFKATIKQDGIDDPLDVTPEGAISDGQRRYLAIREIVAEEKLEYEEYDDGRVRAGRTIPIYCSDLTPIEELKRGINKNVHREGINAHDLANGISDIVEELGSQHDAAIFLAMSDAWVSERLAVLSTPERSFDPKEKKVVEKKREAISVDDVPKSKLSTVGGLLSSTGGSKTLRKKIVEEAKTLPREDLKKLKKEVKEEKDITPEEVVEKIEEAKEKIKRTTNRTFRLDNEVNDGLNVAKGRGMITDHHEFGNKALREALRDLGVLD